MQEQPKFEANKEKKELPDWVKKLRTYGIASTVALTSFLASCENGPKEKANLEDIQNHIENADFEKVSPEVIKAFELKFNDQVNVNNEFFNSKHPESEGTITMLERYFNSSVHNPDNYHLGQETKEYYDISENDSLIKIDYSNHLSFKDGFSDKENHAEIDRKTGVITYYNYSEQSHLGTAEENDLKGLGLLSLYVIEKGGEVNTKGQYQEGQAKAFVEKIAAEIKDMKSGDDLK